MRTWRWMAMDRALGRSPAGTGFRRSGRAAARLAGFATSIPIAVAAFAVSTFAASFISWSAQ
jgi:hypothetical protein